MNRLPGKTKKSVRFRALPPLLINAETRSSAGAHGGRKTDFRARAESARAAHTYPED